MTTLVELECPADRIGLARTFDRDEAFEFRIDGMIGDAPPLVWTSGTDRSAVETALEGDPSVDVIASLANATDDRWLFRLEFGRDLTRLQEVVTANDGAILAATGRDGAWTLELLFHDHVAVSETHARLADLDYEVSVQRVTSLDERSGGQTPLTDTQYETIVAAHELGYFDVPREVTLQELAEELGISHQALSERLRRSHAALVSAELSNRIAPTGVDR